MYFSLSLSPSTFLFFLPCFYLFFSKSSFSWRSICFSGLQPRLEHCTWRVIFIYLAHKKKTTNGVGQKPSAWQDLLLFRFRHILESLCLNFWFDDQPRLSFSIFFCASNIQTDTFRLDRTQRKKKKRKCPVWVLRDVMWGLRAFIFFLFFSFIINSFRCS